MHNGSAVPGRRGRLWGGRLPLSTVVTMKMVPAMMSEPELVGCTLPLWFGCASLLIHSFIHFSSCSSSPLSFSPSPPSPPPPTHPFWSLVDIHHHHPGTLVPSHAHPTDLGQGSVQVYILSPPYASIHYKHQQPLLSSTYQYFNQHHGVPRVPGHVLCLCRGDSPPLRKSCVSRPLPLTAGVRLPSCLAASLLPACVRRQPLRDCVRCLWQVHRQHVHKTGDWVQPPGRGC